MSSATAGVAWSIDRLIADRSRRVDASGIRRVFDLAAKLKDPINLSIGQPDFPVPDAIKRAAADAIMSDRNGYTVTQGVPVLRERIARHLADDVGWSVGGPGTGTGLIVTSGTSGALWLALLALVNPGDEVIIPDPYFVLYPHLSSVCDARAVRCDTYPDCRMTAERVEPLLTARTKMVILNSPSNPAGVVATQRECAELLELCRRRGVLLVSDEIYDRFLFSEDGSACPSPAREPGAAEHMLLVRGFGKTYGVTGWRLGYAAGPARLIEEMTKLQQYSFVCAPAPLQWGAAAALDVDMSREVADYRARRDLVVHALREVTDVPEPGGAFYAFPRVPARLGLTGAAFVERCLERGVLLIPGGVFSDRDTHVRISYATKPEMLERGLRIVCELMRG